jgi:hypothetical protein
MMVVTDMDGRPLTEIANPCPWMRENADKPDVLAHCLAEWRQLADDLDFEPQFRVGPLGFECARAYVRSGRQLVGMVLAGGVSPSGNPSADLYQLDDEERRQVLTALPKVAAAISRSVATDQSAPSIAEPVTKLRVDRRAATRR